MNVRLLRQVQKAILAEPELYSQAEWIQYHGCETVCCIAGWACRLDNERQFKKLAKGETYFSVSETGQRLLDLDDDLSFTLFLGWDGRWASDLAEARTPRARAQVASDYIDYFIETYGDK